MGSFNGAGSGVGLVPGISETIALANAAGMLAECFECFELLLRERERGNSR